MRYCTCTNVEQGTHGTQSGAHDSTLQVELYMNTFLYNYAGNEEFTAFISRGGTTVIWSNSFLQSATFELGAGCLFQNECASASWASEFCTTNWQYPQNYPSPQQVGQGVVAGVQGTVPVYIWTNTFNGSGGFVGLGIDANDAKFIVQGRDIFTNSIMPGYTPLVFPHPLVSTIPPVVQTTTLVPFGAIGQGNNLH